MPSARLTFELSTVTCEPTRPVAPATRCSIDDGLPNQDKTLGGCARYAGEGEWASQYDSTGTPSDRKSATLSVSTVSSSTSAIAAI